MVLGWAGTAASMVTARVRAVPFPQELLGVTVIVPPAVPAVTVMLFVLPPAVLVHPVGKVQL